MILTKLYEKNYLNISEILYKEHKNLGLSTNELLVLILLFRNKNKQKVFSIVSISRKIDFSQNEIAEIISSLLEKGFLEINLEKNNDREREIYSLDKTLNKLKDLLMEEIKEDVLIKEKTNITETIELFEQKVNRVIQHNELERIRDWYENFKYKHENIIDAINTIERGVTLMKVERLLNVEIDEDEELDPEVDAALERIYKRI